MKKTMTISTALRLSSVFILSVTILFFTFATVKADSGAISGTNGGTLKLYNERRVSMEAEQIFFKIKKEPELQGDNSYLTSDVFVSYTFKNNTDKPVIIKTGFPEVFSDCSTRKEGISCRMRNFKATINGKEVRTRKEEGELSESDYQTTIWHTYDISFQPLETLTVTNAYSQPLLPGREGSGGYAQSFTYILETGASWQGVIKSIDIEGELSGTSLYNVADLSYSTGENREINLPGGKRWIASTDGTRLQLHLNNLEPTAADNVHFTFTHGPNTFSACNWKVSDIKDIDAPDTASASSVKPLVYSDSKDGSGDAYFACQAFDGDVTTAWISANNKGIGSILSYYSHISTQITSLFVARYGTPRRSSFFTGKYGEYPPPGTANDYSRPKKIRLTFFNGGEWNDKTNTLEGMNPIKTFILTLPDRPSGSIPLTKNQRIEGELVKNLSRIDIEILSVYPGAKYKDVAIAELSFNGFPIGVDTVKQYTPLFQVKSK